MTQEKIIILIKHIVTVSLLMLITACASTGSSHSQTALETEVTKNAPKALEMSFKKGQVLSLISLAPKSGPAAANVRKQYLQNAFGLAREFGLEPAGSLPVAAVEVGAFAPAAISFFSWPSAQDEERFSARPEWSAIKATRPDGWDELRIHDVELERDVSLCFESNKTYTMATAWLNPDHPDDYDNYLANIEKAVNASGGRFLYQMREPRFTSHAAKTGAPGRVTFVEWDTPQGLEKFQATTSFKTNVHYLQSGTTGFELIVLEPPGA